ncbi:MAG TPA: Uma2 family endonuclease [Byssovorax sp.]
MAVRVAAWRVEHMPRMADVPFFTLAPDWVCEILSPSTEKHDRGKKMRHYAKAGIGHLWLVHPPRDPLRR